MSNPVSTTLVKMHCILHICSFMGCKINYISYCRSWESVSLKPVGHRQRARKVETPWYRSCWRSNYSQMKKTAGRAIAKDWIPEFLGWSPSGQDDSIQRPEWWRAGQGFHKKSKRQQHYLASFLHCPAPWENTVRWRVGCTHVMKKTFTGNLTLSDIHSRPSSLQN